MKTLFLLGIALVNGLLNVSCAPIAWAQTPRGADAPPVPSAGQPLPAMCGQTIQGPNGQQIDWPTILIDDDASALDQQQVVKSLGRRFDDFTKNSINAPIDIQSERRSVGDGVFRIYQYCFVVHCDLDRFTDQRVMESLLADENDRQPPEKLEPLEGDPCVYLPPQTLFKRVQWETVVRSHHQRSDRSSLATAMVVAADSSGRRQSRWAAVATPDQFHPYLGMATIAKATVMPEVQGALFVEVHLVFFEPSQWFDGKNLLGAKLPLLIQNQVRRARRELAKAAQSNAAPKNAR